jgi:diacylglycerol kinase
MLDKKLRSFGYAFKGLKIAWQEEFNFRFEVVCMFLALGAAWFFRIPQDEWLIVLFVIGFVLTAEAFNTALEELCDKFSPSHDPHIAKIKDLAAAAVFIASIVAFVVGCIIFIPHLLTLI